MLKLFKYKRIFIILLTYSVTMELLSTNTTDWDDILVEDIVVPSSNPIFFSEVKNFETNYINNNTNNQTSTNIPSDNLSFISFDSDEKENINNLNKRKRKNEKDISEKEQPKPSKPKKDNEEKAQKKPISKKSTKRLKNNKKCIQINNEEQNSEVDEETEEDPGNLSMCWTKESEKLLKALNKQKYSSEEISKEINNNFNMNCTTDDVNRKCLLIGLNTQSTAEMLETFIKGQKLKGHSFKEISEEIKSTYNVVVSDQNVRKICIKLGLHEVRKQVQWTKKMRTFLINSTKKFKKKEGINFKDVSKKINKKFSVETNDNTVKSEYRAIQDKIAKEKQSHK